MSGKEIPLVIGGPPRADLLPPELKLEKVASRQRGNLVAILILIVFLVGVGYVGSTVVAAQAAIELAAAQQKSEDLLTEQAKYADTRQLQTQLAAAQRALVTTTSSEVDWNTYLRYLSSALPSGSTYYSITMNSQSPVSSLAPDSSPLARPRTIAIEAVVQTSNHDDAAQWLNNLSQIPAFVDVVPTVTSYDTGVYRVTAVLTLDERALWGRYATQQEDGQ
jgi:hypothetical protein